MGLENNKGSTAENDSQARADASGYTIDSKFTTGGAAKEAYGPEGGPEVGRGADQDPANANKG